MSCKVKIGTAYVGAPSRSENRTAAGAFSQFFPRIEDDAELLQRALLAAPPPAGITRKIGLVLAAIGALTFLNRG